MMIVQSMIFNRINEARHALSRSESLGNLAKAINIIIIIIIII